MANTKEEMIYFNLGSLWIDERLQIKVHSLILWSKYLLPKTYYCDDKFRYGSKHRCSPHLPVQCCHLYHYNFTECVCLPSMLTIGDGISLGPYSNFEWTCR